MFLTLLQIGRNHKHFHWFIFGMFVKFVMYTSIMPFAR